MNRNNSRPNIIVIILDALRAKSVSCYGYNKRTTPYLDDFALENFLFRHAFTTSTWTIPTHASMLSGLYLSQHRIENVKGDRRFNESIVTLPQALHERGYTTAAFSQNMLFSPEYHFEDFDTFKTLDERLDVERLTGRKRKTGDLGNVFGKASKYMAKAKAPRRIFNSIYDWIKADHDPFFLMVNITNTHYPWAPPLGLLLSEVGMKNLKHLTNDNLVNLKPFQYNSGNWETTETQRRMWRLLYDASIMHVDREVGRFLRKLQGWQGWNNTYIVVTADHGEMLGEYRNIVGHTLCLHDNILHVPMIIKVPHNSIGTEVEGVVQTVDLYPTVLDWAGVTTEHIPPAQLKRASLTRAMAEPNIMDGLAFAEEDYTDSYNVMDGLLRVNPNMDENKYPKRQVAIRSATHKYIWYDDRPGEFYNLVKDPDEGNNLFGHETGKDNEIFKDLQRSLETWYENLEIFPPRQAGGSAVIDGEAYERLRELGYVD
jgi:arylsulfatase A-like enzyme